jgi:MSHA biogenesis protein MshM
MYLEHFGLNEPPFRITPDTDFFFQGANRGATLDALLYAITHDEGIVKVSGEVGSGKTMLCRVLMERLPASVETIYLANPSLSRDEMLLAIADELKLKIDGERAARVLRALQDHLIRLFGEGRRVVVLIDEAHAMPKETLEEIRLLSNLESNRHKLLQIVLFGQPELDRNLDKADMRQLKERITHGFVLEPLVRSDIEIYIDFRMRAAGYRGPNVFSPAAIKVIAGASEGLTRRVNILADKALLAAFAGGGHAVGEAEARRAVRDSEFSRSSRGKQKIHIGLAALAAGLILGWGLHVLLPGSRPVETPISAAAGATARAVAAPAPVPVPAAAQVQAPQAYAPPPTVSAATTGESLRIGPVPPSRGELSRARFAATQEWLKTAPRDHYAIQLVTVNSGDIDLLEDFLLNASASVPTENLFVYSVKIDGRQHFRAAYGLYASLPDALAAMNGLPRLFTERRPYIRSVGRMQSQNRQ